MAPCPLVTLFFILGPLLPGQRLPRNSWPISRYLLDWFLSIIQTFSWLFPDYQLSYISVLKGQMEEDYTCKGSNLYLVDCMRQTSGDTTVSLIWEHFYTSQRSGKSMILICSSGNMVISFSSVISSGLDIEQMKAIAQALLRVSYSWLDKSTHYNM